MNNKKSILKFIVFYLSKCKYNILLHRLDILIKYSNAIRFDGAVKNGRTEPLRLAIETDGDVFEVIAKISQGNACSVESLVNEMLGAVLAADLGLPISEPFFVRISEDFASIIPDENIKDRIQNSNSLAFGSKYTGKQWRRWIPEDKLAQTQIDQALGVMSFDGFIDNLDRKPQNSNLLVKGNKWILIDHELAFGFLRLLTSDGPWTENYLEPLRAFGADSEHIFCNQLCTNNELNFNSIIANWKSISDIRLAEYNEMLPIEWDEVRQSYSQRISRIKSIRDNIELCVVELKRVLRHA